MLLTHIRDLNRNLVVHMTMYMDNGLEKLEMNQRIMILKFGMKDINQKV